MSADYDHFDVAFGSMDDPTEARRFYDTLLGAPHHFNPKDVIHLMGTFGWYRNEPDAKAVDNLLALVAKAQQGFPKPLYPFVQRHTLPDLNLVAASIAKGLVEA